MIFHDTYLNNTKNSSGIIFEEGRQKGGSIRTHFPKVNFFSNQRVPCVCARLLQTKVDHLRFSSETGFTCCEVIFFGEGKDFKGPTF